MESGETRPFNDLVEQFLGGRLPDELAGQIDFPGLSVEAQGVVLRFLGLMKRSSCPVTEINAQMIWLLAAVTPGMLPGAWGGRIPPVTSQGRHCKLDHYVARHAWPSSKGQPVFIDLGCGFPPVTAVDSAKYLSDWFVYGVDRSFARYVLYDAEGRYACFNRDGEFQYFQSPAKPLAETPEAVRARFKSLFADLGPRLKSPGGRASETVEKDDHKLVKNHIKDYEAENLNFLKAEINDLRLQPARFIRCMNVLLYFEKEVRQTMLSSIVHLLDDAGLLMTGFNHPFGIYARYAVYAKNGGNIRPHEFAFSPDNLRPLGIGPWLTLAGEDQEAGLLADLTGLIRADRIFWPDFYRHVDELRAKAGICQRGDDGFNYFNAEMPLKEIMEKTTAMWNQVAEEGYTDGAVQALRRAGLKAWKNTVGDIAVRPPEGALPNI